MPFKEIYSTIWYDIYSEEIEKYYSHKRIIPIEPEILINSINTGNSVNLKLADCYIPRVKFFKKGDIEVEIPKKMGVIALVGYFTLQTLTAFSSVSKNIFETKKAWYEKEKARIEYEIKLKDTEKLAKQQQKYLEELNREKYLAIENKCYELRNVLVKRTNINNLYINKNEVYSKNVGKDNPDKPDNSDWQVIDDKE